MKTHFFGAGRTATMAVVQLLQRLEIHDSPYGGLSVATPESVTATARTNHVFADWVRVPGIPRKELLGSALWVMACVVWIYVAMIPMGAIEGNLEGRLTAVAGLITAASVIANLVIKHYASKRKDTHAENVLIEKQRERIDEALAEQHKEFNKSIDELYEKVDKYRGLAHSYKATLETTRFELGEVRKENQELVTRVETLTSLVHEHENNKKFYGPFGVIPGSQDGENPTG